MTESESGLLVVIVNYRLAAHIESLLASGVLDGHDVLLVDNGSQPDLVEALARQHGTDLFLLDRNYGFAGAINRAISHADSTADVLLLNPDVRLKPGDIDALRRAMAGTDLTAVSPLPVAPDGSTQVGTAGGHVTPWTIALYFLFVSHVLQRARGAFYTRKQLLARCEPAWLCMACLLVRSGAFHTPTLLSPRPEG
ncbi:MAG: glycosyltransferase [Actinomycetota bacterium]|nr:glycosyltransferase [Actinomycetota bacterium]